MFTNVISVGIDCNFQRPYLNPQLSTYESEVTHLTNSDPKDADLNQTSKRTKREEKKIGHVVDGIFFSGKLSKETIDTALLLSKEAIFDVYKNEKGEAAKKISENNEFCFLFNSIINKNFKKFEQETQKLLTQTDARIQNKLQEALIAKLAFSSLLSESQPLLHLGKKLTQLSASYSVLESFNETPLTLINVKDLGRGSNKKATWQLIFETGKSIAQLKTKLSGPNISKEQAVQNKFSARREADMLHQVNGLPHVVNTYMITYCSSMKANQQISEHQILLMELFPKGNLFDFLNKAKLNNKQKFHIIHGLLTGLVAIHSRNVVHCDLKSTNFLVKEEPNDPDNYYVAISDFGLARKADDLKNAITTYWYMAPELWDAELKKKATAKLDAWSMGCILWELVSSKWLPWALKFPNWPNTFEAHKSSEGFKILMDPNTFQEPKDKNTLNWIIWKMLRIDPEQRFSAQEALNALEKIGPKS